MESRQKKYYFFKSCLFLVMYLGILTINAQMFTIAFGLLCLYSLTGKEQAIKALSLMVISKYLNPALFAFSPETGILAWLVFFLLVLG